MISSLHGMVSLSSSDNFCHFLNKNSKKIYYSLSDVKFGHQTIRVGVNFYKI